MVEVTSNSKDLKAQLENKRLTSYYLFAEVETYWTKLMRGLRNHDDCCNESVTKSDLGVRKPFPAILMFSSTCRSYFVVFLM